MSTVIGSYIVRKKDKTTLNNYHYSKLLISMLDKDDKNKVNVNEVGVVLPRGNKTNNPFKNIQNKLIEFMLNIGRKCGCY